MPPDSALRRHLLLLAAALALAGAVPAVLTAKVPGRTWTVLQAGEVRAIGHRGVISSGQSCAGCHR